MPKPDGTLAKLADEKEHWRTSDLPAFVAQQRAQAAYEIARDLPADAASIMQALRSARTREEAMTAEKRSIGFGVMVDKLRELTGPSDRGRYSQSGQSEETIDQWHVLDALREVPDNHGS